MPSITTKLSSFSKSVKKSFKKVAQAVSFTKKSKKVVASPTTTVQIAPQQTMIGQPIVLDLPVWVQEATSIRPLLSATFGSEEDDLLEQEAEEETVFSREFSAEKTFETEHADLSVVVGEEEKPERCTRIKLLKNPPFVKPSRRRTIIRRPSPLRQVTFPPPPPPPTRPTTPTASPTAPSLTSPPISPASSISSIASSLAPSTPRGGSPPRSNAVVENRHRFATYEPIKIRSDGFF